jgi:hypothetical protein
MESLNDINIKGAGKTGFFQHVFNFDEDSKQEISNIVQYALLALIPIIFLNKTMQKYVPEADEEKGSIEILAEIILQTIIIFLGILFIHRIITYIPTYSGLKYADFSVTNIIIAVLIIILSLQTKLGEKVSILVDRLTDLWEGTSKNNKKEHKKSSIKVSQPISQNNNDNYSSSNVNVNSSSNSHSNQDLHTTSLSLLPPPLTNNSQEQCNYQEQSSVPSSTYESFGPMAANEALGGGGFGGSNW